ncbi:putative N-acetyltransferase 8B [Hippoglossus hippoglossus]|uniref:N-acetyltransferase 8-like 2 n=1 Tax=Hippoglossus stenolepis TaxID=195615 RepID=UPI00148CE47C|nr:putative N-acetyltransferase 8B [Hippoglossus hippoglossus]XP_035008355.1 N-acetyltransferase 8-like 2 [Hippoglossus stenolepis]
MQLVIRRYRPSDRDTVLALYSTCMWEHIHPCFQNSMTRPHFLAITLALCGAGYHLGSVFGAVLLPGLWMGLVYYCCNEIYAGYVSMRLKTDMQDIPGNFLSRPDDCFWVAEAEIDGRVQIMGTVAVLAKQSEKEKYGELQRMIISPVCRRVGLGSRMAQTVVDFCKEQGFSKVALETSSTQTPAVALYKKLGFCHVPSHIKPEAPSWVVMLANVSVLKMEKQL